MYGQIMKVLTQVVLLPLVMKLVKYFEHKLKEHFENERIKQENKKKEAKFQDAKTDEEVKNSFEKLP